MVNFKNYEKEITQSVSLGGSFKDIMDRLKCKYNWLDIIGLQAFILENHLDYSKVTSEVKDYYPECYECAKTCKTFKEFLEASNHLYNISRVCGWLRNKFTWLTNSKLDCKQPNYWNENTVKEAALKYKTLKEFRTSETGAYTAARENNWLKDYTWLSSYVADKTQPIWSVYVYEISETYVYIGLTYNLHRRHLEHCRKSKADSLYKCCEELGVSVPNYILIKENLTGEEAQILEDSTKRKYQESGKWIIINKGKTGLNTGSLGCSSRKWDYDACYKAAKQCKTRQEFKERFVGAYNASKLNKWEFDWLPKFVYNYDSAKAQYRAVVQYTKEGTKLNTFDSIQGAKDALGITSRSSAINDVCRGRKKTAYGYVWKYLDEIEDI